MPIDGGNGHTAPAKGGGKKGGGKKIPTAPKPTPPKTKGGTSGGGGGGSKGGSGGGGGGAKKGGSGGGGGDPYLQAQKKAEKKAGNRYLEQARNLQAQADALRRALRKDFKKALRIDLRNINLDLRQADKTIMDGYTERTDSLKKAAQDNNKAEAAQSNINVGNQIRERNSAVSQAMAVGAGESDLMQTQMMSLRNWQANQSEIQRSFFDTLSSINSSLTDLNVDTKTARINAVVNANERRDLSWQNYYDRRSEALTNLGNVLTGQADYLAMAREMGVGKGAKGKRAAAKKAFNLASKEAGKGFKSPGVGKKLMAWDGRDDFTAEPKGTSKLVNAAVVSLDKKPEGATLRKW